MKSLKYLHPILFTIYPILKLYTENSSEIGSLYFNDLLAILFFILGTAFVSTLCYFLFQRNLLKSVIFTSIQVLFFFHLKQIHYIYSVNFGFILFTHFTLAYVSISFLLALVMIFPLKKYIELENNFLNTLACVLILFVGLNYVFFKSKGRTIFWDDSKLVPMAKNVKKGIKKPDIYYFILDGYAGEQTMKKIYNYENSDFYNFLEDKGFKRLKNSYSNYGMTPLSLSSTMNLMYLSPFVNDSIDPKSPDMKVLREMMVSTRVKKFLRELGYKTVYYTPGHNVTWLDGDNDIAPCQKFSPFSEFIIENTPFSFFMKMIKDPRETTLCALSGVKEIKKQYPEEPLFVFMHVFLPHPPYVFGRNGELLNDLDDKGYVYRYVYRNVEAYRNQAYYINQHMKVIIDGLLQQDKKPAIFLQSDHGADYYGVAIDYKNNNPDKNRTAQLTSLHNLSAFYWPDGGQEKIYPQMSPVNNFRLFFNHYFKTDFEILPDQYFIADPNHHFRFTELKPNQDEILNFFDL